MFAMDNDFDLSGEAPVKSQAKKGRRAKPVLETTVNSQAEDEKQNVPPRPSRRQTGWGTSNTSTANEDVFDTRLLPDNNNSSGGEEEDLPVIPDLEELHEDDMTQEIAAPPTMLTSNIATFRQLDAELMNQSAFRTLDGDIDLKVLVKNLSSEAEVREEKDVEWKWDQLFAEVSAALKSKQDSSVILQKPTKPDRII